MLARWLTYISFGCFGVLILLAFYITRKPLCIDSKVVERIDRLGIFSTDLVYRCAINKEVKFSSFFNERSRDLSQRIIAVERFLESIEPFSRKVQVSAFEDRPQLFKVQDHHIFISQALLNERLLLEKALAKVWYREKADSFFINSALLEEVVTDFLVYGATGDVVAEMDSYKWPYSVKSVPEYCESAWKFPEHALSCQSGSVSDATEFSLRPMLLNTWIQAYKGLDIFEQGKFLKSFADLLKDDHTPSLPIVKNLSQGVSNSPLWEASEVVRNINSYIATSHVMRSSEALREFVVNLNQELNSSGFKDSFTEAYFDVLFVSEKPLTDKAAMYLHFKEIAKKNPKVHIALKDSENVWLMPTKYPIPLKAFGQIKANKTIVEKCGSFDFSYVLKFSEQSEKLLVVDTCNPAQIAKYTNYLKEGAEGFGEENKGIAFVQFHIPSIVMKRTQLATAPNVYDLVQNGESSRLAFQTLGWQELKWNPKAEAYKPKAFVDGIELFRAPEKTN